MVEPLPLPTPTITTHRELPDQLGVLVVFSRQSESGSDRDKSPGEVSAQTLTALDGTTRQCIEQLIAGGEIEGKPGEVLRLATTNQQVPMLVVAGLGPISGITRGAVLDAAAAVVRQLADKPRKKITFFLDDSIEQLHHDALVAGTITACEGQHI